MAEMYGGMHEGSSRAKRELAVMRHKFSLASPSEEAIGLVETAGIATALGVLEGRYGADKFRVFKSDQKDAAGNPIKDAQGNVLKDPNSGVHVAAVAGVAAHLLSYTSMSDGYEGHLRNVGDGLLTVAGYDFGQTLGAKMKQKADQAAAGTGTGGTMTGDNYPAREIGAGHPGFPSLTPEERRAWFVAKGR